MNKIRKSSKPAFFFDITWFISFILFQILPFIVPETRLNPTSFFLFSCMVGSTMLFSKNIKTVSIVAKILHWFALNAMKPRTEYNHIIWGLFILLIAVSSVLFSEKPTNQELEYFKTVNSSVEFWVGITIIFILNILVGVYTAKKHNKNKI